MVFAVRDDDSAFNVNGNALNTLQLGIAWAVAAEAVVEPTVRVEHLKQPTVDNLAIGVHSSLCSRNSKHVWYPDRIMRIGDIAILETNAADIDILSIKPSNTHLHYLVY